MNMYVYIIITFLYFLYLENNIRSSRVKIKQNSRNIKKKPPWVTGIKKKKKKMRVSTHTFTNNLIYGPHARANFSCSRTVHIYTRIHAHGVPAEM